MNLGRLPLRVLPGIRESSGRVWRHRGDALKTYGIIVAFLLLVAVVAAGSSSFLTRTNLFNLASQWAPAGIMAVGMTYVILTGGFDLSIASGYSLCAVAAAGIGRNHSPEIAFFTAIAVGLAIGVLNGGLIAFADINPFITTVGTGFILNGIALVVVGNYAYIVSNPAFATFGAGRWHNFPYSGFALIGFLVAGGVLLAKTIYGQQIYAVGGNMEAARLSGIPVRGTIASAYVVSGLCMGVAGCISASQLSSAQANIDPNIVFDVITVVVVGGTSLGGGVGAMWRTVIGLGIIGTISNGFDLINVSPYYQNIVKGTIIVAALGLDMFARRMAARAGSTDQATEAEVVEAWQ